MPVYFIREGETGPVKIGHAAHPKRRMTLLQTGNPNTLRLLRVIEGGPEVEAEAHAFFAGFRLAREWFVFDYSMMTYGREVVVTPSTPKSALHGYLKGKRGTVKSLAAALGVNQAAISQWGKVPAERVLEVERFTGLSRHVLRPDLYGPKPLAAGVQHEAAR